MSSVRPSLPRSFRPAVLSLLVGAALAGASLAPAHASSHREAPFIATQPQLDATDFYMFRSYEAGRDGYVTLIANYLPLQDPYGGPNYFKLDPNALYEIHISNDGGAAENITFSFRFQNRLDDNQIPVGGKMVSIPLVQNASADVNVPNSPALNVHETYTVDIIRGNRRTGVKQSIANASTGATTFDKPVDNIGQKTIKDYIGYANKHIYSVAIPGCAGNGRVFVGQRKDPFVVNLGETFDLVNIKYPAVELQPFAEFATHDSLADANVTSIIVEAPIACLTEGKGNIIGGWTTASIPASRVLSSMPSQGLDPTAATGSYVQVSRLGMPLVNEVVIGLKDKNKFNASEPKDDGQFADYVTNPTLPTLVEALFGSAGVKAPTNFPRTDLVAAFLTGVDGLNKPANVTASEMVRLNTSIGPTAAGAQSRLGVLGGDNAGFPNGRRPGDDVVDIELRVAMGVLCTVPGVNTAVGCKASDAPAGALKYTDGAYIYDGFFHNVFPYLHAPLPGSPNDDNAIKAAVRR
ncbi:MAG TPA: DUF4331 domain-containing protein [Casimicrobiaceae bacterium]|nr:DUF4331 domain-containing protein [Casimicrobiaceae bacterium]